MDAGLIFFRISGYLKYRFIAMNRKGHGIHSPFVFDLVNRVFRSKPERSIVAIPEDARKKLLKDKRLVEVNDLGSGGAKAGKVKITLASITGRSSVTPKYGRLLSKLASEFGQPLILEFGTAAGISAMYLAAACRDTRVISMEGNASLADYAEAGIRAAGLDNVIVMKGPFTENLPVVSSMKIAPGLVFIDGDHRKKPLLDYFNTVLSMSTSETVIIIDDINYSPEMAEAWKEIRNHAKVTQTVDIYRMGLVFLRTGMTHKHYIIRY